MKKVLLSMVLAAGMLGAADFSIGVNIGPPPPPRVVRVRPAAPGPDYNWVDGYWYANDGRWRWHDGYWTRPPYAGARWIAPRYEGRQFFNGYWESGSNRYEHDHAWDRDRNRRDYDRNDNRDRDRH
jgi:hypothetical protein